MLAFGFPGGAEWLVILIIALLLFGSRLPSIMRSIGRSITEFKKGVGSVDDEVSDAVAQAQKPAQIGEAPEKPDQDSSEQEHHTSSPAG